VKTVTEYRKNAAECRALAKQMKPGEQRDQLLKMAETWDVLAEQRERSLPFQAVEAPVKPPKE
jgi:hypothetical protein